MNAKGIAVIVGVAIVIISVALLPNTPGNVPPAISDMPEFSDAGNLGISSNNEPEIFDDTTIEFDLQPQEFEPDVDFFINENGTKVYIIDAVDSPEIKK